MFGETETKTFGQTETDMPVKTGIEASVQRRHRQSNGDRDTWGNGGKDSVQRRPRQTVKRYDAGRHHGVKHIKTFCKKAQMYLPLGVTEVTEQVTASMDGVDGNTRPATGRYLGTKGRTSSSGSRADGMHDTSATDRRERTIIHTDTDAGINYKRNASSELHFSRSDTSVLHGKQHLSKQPWPR